MINNIDYKDMAILVDFDGTITTKDTNVKLIDIYGNENTDKMREEFKEGKLTFPQYFQGEMKEIRLTEEEYLDFLIEKIEISPGFMEFYKTVKEKEIRLGIISGGFINGIRHFLKQYGIEDIEIFANELVFDGDRAHIEFLDGEDYQCCDKGPCGNCKIEHYKRYKEDAQTIIFVGDGVTDMPVAEVSDIVFAKDSLARYLDEKEISYIKYQDFKDINKLIFN